ncbi:MAG: metal ABC transporter permease [Thermomicrobiales bacterium]
MFLRGRIVLLTYIQHNRGANQAGLDKFLFGQAATLVERTVLQMGAVGLVALLIVAVFYKEFKLLSFDPEFTASLGFGALARRRPDLADRRRGRDRPPDGRRRPDGGDADRPGQAARQWTNQLGVMIFPRPSLRRDGRWPARSSASRRPDSDRPDDRPLYDGHHRPGLDPLRPGARHRLGGNPAAGLQAQPGAAGRAAGESRHDLPDQRAAVILLTGIFAASSCALVGSFLVLRRMAMMADAISHAILPGLVFSFVPANGPNLFVGIFGASLAGLTTVVAVEALQRTGLLKSDAAIGIVFPAMFAIGTVLVTRYFSDVHLDADAIYGEIAFSPFDLLIIGNTNYGSYPLIVLMLMTVVNLLAILLFYKELATFDAGLAAALGFSPAVIHYGLMTLVSMTTVGAFSAVGAILVVALMIVPAATAYLLTDRLGLMIALSVAAGAVSAVLGYYAAVAFDVSISGMMVVMLGILFALAALFSPSQGIVSKLFRRRRQRERFAADLLVMHLHHHRTASESPAHLAAELDWTGLPLADRIIDRAQRDRHVGARDGRIAFTPPRRRSWRNRSLGR